MLREADSIGAEELDIAPTYAPARTQYGSIALAAPAQGSRYGESRRLNSPAVVLTVLIHVALLAALFMVRNHFVHKHEGKLTVLNLMPESPPPQSQPEQPKQQPPKVVAPLPLVQTPVQQPVPIQTTPDPAPQPVSLPAAPAAAIPGPPSPPAPASTGVLQKGNIDGNILSAKAPNYPLDSRRKKEQGTVVLSVTIGIDGKVAAISVRKSSGFSRLDDAALDAVRKWRWKPFLENGEPVMIQGSLPIPFVLQG